MNYSMIISKIKELNLNIDSLYIEQDSYLQKLIDKTELHELRSCSKILVAIAMGIAIEKGLFSLDENVYSYLEKYITNENNKPKIKEWTIRTLLTHKTGYDKMLMTATDILENNIDKTKLIYYVLNYNIMNIPNTIYVYNNVEPFIISILFKEKHNIDLEEYIKENIFKKMNIDNYKWDRYGEYCPGCTGLYLYPYDFHKLAKLLINNGRFGDYQVVSSEWINEMISMQVETPNLINIERVFPKMGAGYYTFISRDNYVLRDGANGQYLIINKEKNLAISIMSSEKDMASITEIFRDIL